MASTHLHLNDVPLLATSLGKWLPNLLAHAHVFLAQTLKLSVVKVVLTTALHETLVAFSACVSGLSWEGFALDLIPVLAHGTKSQKCPVILLIPCSG